MAVEVALSTLLLIATGLLFHTLWNLEHARLGFDVTRVTSFTRDAGRRRRLWQHERVSERPSKRRLPVATLFYQPTLERMRQVPGVQEAALISSPPLSGINMSTSFNLVGQTRDPNNTLEATNFSGERRLCIA